MTVVEKTYNTPDGELKFEFNYDETVAVLTDFFISSVSNLKYGYDSADQKEISIYPSGIDIVIDDFEGDNYNAFKSLFKSYYGKYPFNYYSKLFIQIKLNSAIIFKGILDALESDNESMTLKLSFVDGINKYKNVYIYNPVLLDLLYDSNLIQRSHTTPYIGQPHGAAYGFGEIYYKVNSTLGETVITPGYMIKSITTGDKDTRLSSIITALIKLLRYDLNVEYENLYKYGDINTATGDMVDISVLNVRRILSNLIGRYVVIIKVNGRENQIGDSSAVPDYSKPDKFNLVFEDEIYKVYFHDFNGTVSSKKYEKGIEEKTIADILKVLARNTFSYFGLKNYNTFLFRHKRYISDPITLTGIMKMSKTLTIDKVDYLQVKDYFTGHYSYKGSLLDTDNKIEYKIPLVAFPTEEGYEYRLNWFYGTTEKRVIHFYDPQIDFRDYPIDVITTAEWELHKNYSDQYELELQGIDYDFDATYYVNYGNYSGNVRPITLEKDLLNSKTKMTALEIG